MSPADADRAYLKTLKLLYVEDVPVVRQHLRHRLGPLVGGLILAEDGAEGLERFRSERPHLVVTDIVMPGADGLRMAAAIRELDPEVPIILTTAHGNTEYLLAAIELGVEKYVFKPIDFDELEKTLLNCAHRLAAEEQLTRRRQMDAELQRLRHREALSELARGMGHDFNNMFQGILGALSVAKLSTASSKPLQGILELAEQSATQARELGSRLIYLAKGGGALDATGPLGAFLQSRVAFALAGSAIEWRMDWPEDLPKVKYNSRDLQTLVELILANAREAMPSGGTLCIEGRRCEVGASESSQLSPGDYVRCTFRDSGPGIPGELLERIFDPYFTTKHPQPTKGVGLSLAICQAIACTHGGGINAESAPGGGAAFHVYLPVE